MHDPRALPQRDPRRRPAPKAGPNECRESLTLHFPMKLKLQFPRRLALVPPKFWAGFRFHHVWDR